MGTGGRVGTAYSSRIGMISLTEDGASGPVIEPLFGCEPLFRLGDLSALRTVSSDDSLDSDWSRGKPGRDWWKLVPSDDDSLLWESELVSSSPIPCMVSCTGGRGLCTGGRGLLMLGGLAGSEGLTELAGLSGGDGLLWESPSPFGLRLISFLFGLRSLWLPFC